MSEISAAGAAAGDAATAVRRRRSVWALPPGESAIASVGIAIAAVLLAAMAASALWSVRTQQASDRRVREQHVRALGTVLAQSVEVMLSRGELSATRRLLADAGREHELERCRIVLPDGRVLADADPSRITAQVLPVAWSLPVTSEPVQETSATIHLSLPLLIEGRGGAELELAASALPALADLWQTHAGLAVIGAAALGCLLGVYRRTRSKLRAVGALRDALLAMHRGEDEPAVLELSPTLGPEAQTWNRLMEERQGLRRQQLHRRAQEGGERKELGGDLQAACDVLAQGLMLVDGQMRVRYANGAAAVFLQSRPEQLVGADAAKVVTDAGVLEAIRAAADGSSRKRSSFDLQKNGSADEGVLRFGVRPARRGDAASAVVTVEDITQQKVAEASRKTFVAHATHELRTPLTNIRLYVETAIDEGEQDPQTRSKCLNVINAETRRLERLVGEMLSVSEMEAGSFKLRADDVRLDALLEELEADYAAQAADKGVALTFHLPPKLPVLQGDRDKLALALHNLVGNALKYTPAGGSVDVRVASDERQLTFEIKDTGIGIAEQDLPQIFEQYYRANDERIAGIVGTGLGLTLAREIARLHGGEVTAMSALDAGSTFTLAVPVVAGGGES